MKDRAALSIAYGCGLRVSEKLSADMKRDVINLESWQP